MSRPLVDTPRRKRRSHRGRRRRGFGEDASSPEEGDEARDLQRYLERMTAFEPATLTLARVGGGAGALYKKGNLGLTCRNTSRCFREVIETPVAEQLPAAGVVESGQGFGGTAALTCTTSVTPTPLYQLQAGGNPTDSG